MSNRWAITRLGEMSHALRFHSDKVEDEFWLLVQADEHTDNFKTDLTLLKEHHDLAKQRNAPIVKVGDIFCAMQGKWDPRSDQNQLRPELRGNHYLDLLVDFHEKFYGPYAENIALACYGNHETSISKRHQTDLLQRLVDRLRQLGSQCLTGGYAGFIRIQFVMGKSQIAPSASRDLYYHHGFGGGGEVTRGMIDNNRVRSMAVADIVVQGHIHRKNFDQNEIHMLDHSGNAVQRDQYFLRCGSYKDESGPSGYHVENGRGPRPKGGWWLKFEVHRFSDQVTVKTTPIPAN